MPPKNLDTSRNPSSFPPSSSFPASTTPTPPFATAASGATNTKTKTPGAAYRNRHYTATKTGTTATTALSFSSRSSLSSCPSAGAVDAVGAVGSIATNAGAATPASAVVRQGPTPPAAASSCRDTDRRSSLLLNSLLLQRPASEIPGHDGYDMKESSSSQQDVDISDCHTRLQLRSQAPPPPPLALSSLSQSQSQSSKLLQQSQQPQQVKRPPEQSVGAGELGDLLSPYKKARTHSQPFTAHHNHKVVPPPLHSATHKRSVPQQTQCSQPPTSNTRHPFKPLSLPVPPPRPPLPPTTRTESASQLPRPPYPLPPLLFPPLLASFTSSGYKPMSNAIPDATTGCPAPTHIESSAAAAQAANTGLTKVQDITTTRLPKGTVPSPRTSSTPTSWSSYSVEPANAVSARSPDSRVFSPLVQPLVGAGIIELLEQDDRPTFVLDLANPMGTPTSACTLPVLYSNPALRLANGVLDSLTLEPFSNPLATARLAEFKSWVMSAPSRMQDVESIPMTPHFDFEGISWSASTLKRRYRVVRGRPAASSPDHSSATEPKEASMMDIAESRSSTPVDQPTSSRRQSGYFDHGISLPPPEQGGDDSDNGDEDEVMAQPDAFSLELLDTRMGDLDKDRQIFDWTKVPVTDDMPAHFKFAREVDWASSPLGPIEDWSDDLRTMANMVMACPHPAAMYWGPEYVTLYNEAYTVLAGNKHPHLMGQRFEEAWPEIWDEILPVFEEACRSGLATMKHEDRLFVHRHGFLEEAWFSWSVIPLLGSDGSVMGLYNPAFEDTRRKITERRMHTLREVGAQIAHARDLSSFWPLVCKGLSFNKLDVPFALVYSVTEDSIQADGASAKSGGAAPKIVLKGSIGTPESHPAAPQFLDLAASEAGFASYFRKSISAGGYILLKKEDGTFPEALVEGLEWSGYGESSHTLVVCPVHPTSGFDSTVGFIVLATNPRRPFNQDFELFVHLLSRQLDTATASIILFEKEIKRGQHAARMAALDRQELQRLLHIRTQEAEDSEFKFTRMAEFAPVGMFIANSAGDLNYCNDTWWELSRHPRVEGTIHTWMQSVHDEDRLGVQAVWQKFITHKVTITHEFRFKYTHEENGHTMDAWVLLSAFPERHNTRNGIKSIFGCITDISRQKWAETVQIQRREEAFELKRQQENFIDITSHEMRNPLSAILQCADEISSALLGLRASADVKGKLNRVVDSCVEAAATVSLCASHQKRIVDDILTLSKLDSNLLLVTPVDVQPVDLVQQVLKMFDSELNANEISAKFSIEKSFHDLKVDWVKLDPSRLLQVLINLMTNAIKFTQASETGMITVKLGASKDVVQPSKTRGPTNHPPRGGVSFFPARQEAAKPDPRRDTDWGTGEPINLHFSVEDTGEGIGEQEMKALFQRYSQATPRTHVRYGGSGLGLFISRTLTELQGGQIGVTSEAGCGSKFAFYIKSRKCEPPTDKQVRRKADDVIRTVAAAHPEHVQTLLASHNTPSTTMAPSAASVSPSIESPLPVRPSQAMPTLQPPPTSSPSVSSSSHTPIVQQCLPARCAKSPSPFRDILVVEDNLVNQKVLQRQLRNAGHKTQVANHGGEALQIIKHSRFWGGTPPTTPMPIDTPSSRTGHEPNPFESTTVAMRATTPGGISDCSSSRYSSPSTDEEARSNISIILMDLEMPVMDGLTCSRRIRELEASGKIGRHIPIIAVTAYARPEQIETAMAAGIDDVVSKPFRIPDLIPKIEENIARWDL